MTTNANHERRARRLLDAAEGLLAARENRMITGAEWAALRRAAEACRRTAEADRGCEFCREAGNRPAAGRFVCPYCRAMWGAFYDNVHAGRLEVSNLKARRTATAALRRLGILFTLIGDIFTIPAITTRQYEAVLTDLGEAGQPGKDWNFPLD
jgi:hypothetical protein